MKQMAYFLGWVWGWLWVAVAAGLLFWVFLGIERGLLASLGVLGLIVVSGFVATAWMMVTGGLKGVTKRCPYCKERILADAIKCKHCGSDVGQFERLEQLEALLEHSDENARHEAVDELQEMGEPAVPILIDTLNNNSDWLIRALAAHALGKIGDSRAYPHLISALNSRDWVILEATADALVMLGDSRAVPHLISALRDDPSVPSVANALVKLGDVSAIPPLLDFMAKSFGPGPVAAQLALASLGERAIPKLVEHYKNGNFSEQHKAAYALARIGEPAIPALVELVKTAGGFEGYGAAYALGSMGEIARPSIEELLNHPDDEIKRLAKCASEALEKTIEEGG